MSKSRPSEPEKAGLIIDPTFLEKYNSPEFLAKQPSREEVDVKQSQAGAWETAQRNKKPGRQVESDRWPPNFEKQCYKIGVRRYMRDLKAVIEGDKPENDLFRDFRTEWASEDRCKVEGAIILGSTGAGKSVVGLWACLKVSDDKQAWDYLDAGEFADLWAMQDHERMRRLREVGLLVIDEIGDCEDLRGPAMGLIKRTINARYRNEQPTILCTTQDETPLKAAIGDEIVNRFHVRVGTTDKRSYR
jgi:hypothetical protein